MNLIFLLLLQCLPLSLASFCCSATLWNQLLPLILREFFATSKKVQFASKATRSLQYICRGAGFLVGIIMIVLCI